MVLLLTDKEFSFEGRKYLKDTVNILFGKDVRNKNYNLILKI